MDNKKRRIVGVAVISGVILVSVATVGVTKLVNEKNAIEAKTYVTADASNYASSNKVVTVNLNKNNGTGGTDKVRIKKETDATSPEGEYKIYEIDSHGSEFLVTPDDIGGGTHKLEVPTLERYYFKGYYYQDKKIINEDGFISGKYSDSYSFPCTFLVPGICFSSSSINVSPLFPFPSSRYSIPIPL